MQASQTWNDVLDGALCDPYYSAYYVRVELAGADYLPVNAPDFRGRGTQLRDENGVIEDLEYQKFGNRMLPGGDLFEKENAFFETVSSRPEDFVISWLQTVKCPVIRVDGTLPVEENVEYLLSLYHPVNRST